MAGFTEHQKKYLRALGHKCKPVVIIGNAGLSAPVYSEIELAFDQHELIKIRVNAPDREARRDMITTLCRHTGAELVQAIGHVALCYRRNPEKTTHRLPEP